MPVRALCELVALWVAIAVGSHWEAYAVQGHAGRYPPCWVQGKDLEGGPGSPDKVLGDWGIALRVGPMKDLHGSKLPFQVVCHRPLITGAFSITVLNFFNQKKQTHSTFFPLIWLVSDVFTFSFLITNWRTLHPFFFFKCNKQLTGNLLQVFWGHSCVTLQQISCLVQSW